MAQEGLKLPDAPNRVLPVQSSSRSCVDKRRSLASCIPAFSQLERTTSMENRLYVIASRVAAVVAVGLIAGVAASNAADSPTTSRPESSVQALAATRILDAKCVTCHNHGWDNGPGKPKTAWGDDVPRLIKEGLVVPGKPDESKIYKVISVRAGHPGKGNKLTPTAAEVAAIHDWIAGGAADPKAPASRPASQPSSKTTKD
jgi:cytochrome c5